MSSPGAPSSARRQKRMGPAPFASFEDLSDELDSPDDKHAAGSVVRLPGIREDATPSTPGHLAQHQEFIYAGISLVGASVPSPPSSTVGAPPTPPSTTISSLSTPQESQTSTRMSLQTPSTPRIDISRASSSSHHDSRDSTPERELFEEHAQSGAKLGLAFKEEGTLDLRSSTEELDFHEPQEKLKSHKKRSQSPSGLHEDSLHQRKDSQSSEIGLLSISGRTSRLSSIGSQGSTHSRVSNVSHLSIISGQSGRSPSPHKMLLETSFCGNKTPVLSQHAVGHPGTKIDADMLEKMLLARKHDPREVVLAEGITMEINKAQEQIEPVIKKLVKSDIKITVDKPVVDNDCKEQPKSPGIYVAPSGVEYTYIPLKGPLPKDLIKGVSKSAQSKRPLQNNKNKEICSKVRSPTTSPSPEIQQSKTTPLTSTGKKEEPKYIRIKLKPDHMYEDGPAPPPPSSSNTTEEIKKPICLNLNDANKKPFQSFTQVVGGGSTYDESVNRNVEKPTKSEVRAISPKPTRHSITSKSPSPSLSRRSSFTSLFKSRETIVSPESPTGLKRKNTLTGILKDASENIRERTRSRSKSRERDKASLSTAPSSTESIDSKSSKQGKSVLSIFKTKKLSTKSKASAETSSPEVLSSLEGISNVEFKFNTDTNSLLTKKTHETPLRGESIRIPLHSPTHYETRGILQEVKSSSQDSQETVIDTTKYVAAAVVEPTSETNSASSENIVFSTKLDSNDVFTTKLPKDKHKKTNSPVSDVGNNNLPPAMDINQLEIINDDTIKESKKTENNMHTDHQFQEEIVTVIKSYPECTKSIRNSIMSTLANEDRYSSESERDSELDYLKNKKQPEREVESENVEPERKGLVYQQDSYEDELPYVPTTLPLERSVAVPIVPVKQRGTFEMKTYPIERPRSTTPINLSTLEDYCEDVAGPTIHTESITKAIEKLKISLPRDETIERSCKPKSPRKPGANTNWFAFSENKQQKAAQEEVIEPPPLPPKGIQKEWINFEEIPERRRLPRRIQTIPSRSNIEVPEVQENVVYNYVNPEDCKCECHDIAREREQQAKQEEGPVRVHEDEMPLLDDDPGDEDKSAQEFVDRIKIDVAMSDRRSVISDSSIDLSTSLEHPENPILDPSLRTPFTGDLGISSNRSSIVSQDEAQSPDATTPNAFPKVS